MTHDGWAPAAYARALLCTTRFRFLKSGGSGLMVHAEAQGSPSPIDATFVVDVMSQLLLY